MRMQVYVRLKEGVLDVQGKTVENGLKNLGFDGVNNVRIGKLVEFDIAESGEAAQVQVEEICQKLLANPVIESYEIKAVE